MNHPKLTVLAVAACLGLAACGSSGGGSSSSSGGGSSTSTASLSSFRSAFAGDQTRFRQLGAQLGEDIAAAGSKSDAVLGTEFTKLSARAKEQASRLAQLNPPARYKPAVDKLSSAFVAVSSDLAAISSAAAKHDGQAAKAATEKLVGDAGTVKSADTALSKPLGLTAPGA